MKNIFFAQVFLISIITLSCSGKTAKTEYDLNKLISIEKNANTFAIFDQKQNPVPIIISNNDFAGVQKIAGLFQKDIEKLSGKLPALNTEKNAGIEKAIILGTIGKSEWLDQLVSENKIDVSDIKDKWESCLIEVVKEPFPGMNEALVIAGSDKRGTIYGMFELSRKMGVSPWYWWADVTVIQKDAVHINRGRFVLEEPKVKYRGIFLNDEEPALGRWAVKNYGGFTHEFYEHVFELILRLKGNYLWPAMWWASFNSNDTLNPVLADEMGVVMGTTHHEPMNRAHAEWRPYGGKAWNYETNPGQLKAFWKEGIERMGDFETIISVGMRGDGDRSMSEETNISLLEKVVEDQRKIIEEVTKKPAEETPQLWAIYKEVQEYYDRGMRVPDDVTVLLCDDNWGNVRKLPAPDDPPRKGGYGMYYHFDFVGGPRNYKWLNTTQLARVWEQMRLTYEHGVDRIWLVNVGDLKPMELPISFFLDYAWNPDKWNTENLPNYTLEWAKEQFGEKHAEKIAGYLELYTKYNARKTPELLYSDTYSLKNYREFETVVKDYKTLEEEAGKVYSEILAEQKDAYYQLVLHPIQACSNLNEMYYAHALNLFYAIQGRATANLKAEKVKKLFEKDSLITEYFHNELAKGKWDHMMAQTHIGYDNWQQPEKNRMPPVQTLNLKDEAAMGVAIEASTEAWPNDAGKAILPTFDSHNKQKFYIEIFNKGKSPFNFEIKSTADWVNISKTSGSIKLQERVEIDINWEKLQPGKSQAELSVISENGESVMVDILAQKYDDKIVKGFVERNGVVSINADNFSRKKDGKIMMWEAIPNHGKTGSAVTTKPVTVSLDGISDNPVLEYDFYLTGKPEKETVTVNIYLSPTLNFTGKGLHFAIAFDDQEPQIINMHKGMDTPDWEYPKWFNDAVGNKIIIKSMDLGINDMGNHTLKIFAIDKGVVIQKIVIDNGGLKDSYLGPLQSLKL